MGGALLAASAYWLLGAAVFEGLSRVPSSRSTSDDGETEDWGYAASVYYAAITFTTIGLGDYSVRWYGYFKELEVFCFMLFTIIGLVLFVEIGNGGSELISRIVKRLESPQSDAVGASTSCTTMSAAPDMAESRKEADNIERA